MTPEQKAVYISTQIALLNAEIEMMKAENAYCADRGSSPSYTEEHYRSVIDKYEGVLSHNNLVSFFIHD